MKNDNMTNITGFAVRLNQSWYMVDDLELSFLHHSFTLKSDNYRSNFDPEYLNEKYVKKIAKMVLNGIFGDKRFYVIYGNEEMQEILL